MNSLPASQPLFPPELFSSEGTAYKLRSGHYRPKPEVELVVIRLLFGAPDNPEKTFWWVARDEKSGKEVAGGRLMVTSMRDAISAARFTIKQRFKISRTREETITEEAMTLEQWGHQYMERLYGYAQPSSEPSEPGEYHQPPLF